MKIIDVLPSTQILTFVWLVHTNHSFDFFTQNRAHNFELDKKLDFVATLYHYFSQLMIIRVQSAKSHVATLYRVSIYVCDMTSVRSNLCCDVPQRFVVKLFLYKYFVEKNNYQETRWFRETFRKNTWPLYACYTNKFSVCMFNDVTLIKLYISYTYVLCM